MMLWRHRRSGLLLALALLCTWEIATPPSAMARAPSRRELRAKRSAARALYDAGNRKYDVGRFTEALRLFSQAYETLPLPGFLFNIGQCHRMLGQCERANFFYRGYLRRQAEAKNRDLVERLIAGCVEELAVQARRLEAERQARLRATTPRPVLLIKEVIMPPREAFVPPPPRPVPMIRRWWLWTAIGVGAVALATGLGVGLTARTDRVAPSGSLGTYDPWGVR